MEEYFSVNVNKYISKSKKIVYRPASLNNPQNNSVMFVTEKYIKFASSLLKCKDCLVFWPKNIPVPSEIKRIHDVFLSEDPHNEFAKFFFDNNISNYPMAEEYENINGSFISPKAQIGKNCSIFPGTYIGGEVVIGNNVYIGPGVKLIGKVYIGDNVVIRENSVIGADGLTTDRNEFGKALTIPQFGGVIIEDSVQIGALTVIARGAIDDTHIGRGSKIDNCCFISHNVQIGEDAFIVGETIMFGSSILEEQGYISGNATIREGKRIGKKAIVGMGSVVIKNVEPNSVVKGNPAR